MKASIRALVLASISIGLWASTAATAQQYPAKPIRFIVPANTGASTDMIARALARGVSEVTGQAVVVDNRPGASGSIGVNAVRSSPADGYVLMFSTLDPLTVYPSVKKDIPYDIHRDLTAITMVAEVPFALAVSAKSPARTVAEFVAMAKQNDLKFASQGVGTSGHLVVELFQQASSIQMLHVPYKGVAPSIMGVIQGDVQMLATSPTSLRAQVEAGNMRTLVVASSSKSKSMPTVPTAEEAGLKDFHLTAWFGLLGPANMPPELTDQINRIVLEAIKTPNYIKTLETIDATPRVLSKDEFSNFMRSDASIWKGIAQRGRIVVEN